MIVISHIIIPRLGANIDKIRKMCRLSLTQSRSAERTLSVNNLRIYFLIDHKASNGRILPPTVLLWILVGVTCACGSLPCWFSVSVMRISSLSPDLPTHLFPFLDGANATLEEG